MKEIATLIPDDEFQKYLLEVNELVDIWKGEGLGYISLRCQIVDHINGICDDNLVFTVGQLKQLFALAK